MAARCDVCGKGPQVGYSVSHSHLRNKRRFLPNLQAVRATVDGETVRLRVCTPALRLARYSVALHKCEE